MAATQQKEDGFLWVSSAAASDQEILQATAREFELTLHLTTPEKLWETVRSHRFTVVGIDVGASPEQGITLLRQLREKMPALTVVAASRDTSTHLIRSALEAGAFDVLSLPLLASELHKVLIRITHGGPHTAPPGTTAGEVITVYGARGGLGATTLAVNLAVRIASLTSSNCGLVDLDLQRGDVATFLNLTPVQTLAAFASSTGDFDPLFLRHTLLRHAGGVYVLPAPTEIEEAELVGRDQVEKALGLLRARFAHTVVDTARTLTDATLAAFEHSDHVLLLCDLSVPGVRAGRRFLELLARVEASASQVHLVLTGAGRESIKTEDAERALGRRPLITLPRDEAAAAHAMNAGAPLNGSKPSALTLAVTELARTLTGTAPAAGRRGWRRIFGRRGASA